MTKAAREVRKIQFTGKSTFIVSLPKHWVARMGLGAGSRLVITEHDGSLILTPEEATRVPAGPSEAVIRISASDDPGMVVRGVISLYLVGYNYISVQAVDGRISALHRNAIKELARKKLVGAEIIAEAPNEVRLQVLVSYPELSIESALRRISFIATSMHDDAVQALKNLDKKLAAEVIQFDDEVDRFSLYIIRQLKAAVQNEKILRDIGLSNPRDCMGYRVIVKFVERIADHAAKIAENVLALQEKPNETVFQKIYEVSAFSKTVFEDAIKSLFKKDYMLADQVVSKAKTITLLESEAIREIQFGTKQTDIPGMRMIMESIRRTAEYASDIAEIVLNLNAHLIMTI